MNFNTLGKIIHPVQVYFDLTLAEPVRTLQPVFRKKLADSTMLMLDRATHKARVVSQDVLHLAEDRPAPVTPRRVRQTATPRVANEQ